MTALGLVLLIVALLLLGQPLFVILGSVTAYCYRFLGDGEISGMIEDIYFAANKDLLLAIPLFILAGNLMTQGGIARRLIRVATAITAPVPAGLAVAAVLSCAIFAARFAAVSATLLAAIRARSSHAIFFTSASATLCFACSTSACRRASAAERLLASLRTPPELSSPGFSTSSCLNHFIALT